MRIGNPDDIHKSTQSDGLIGLLQPENQTPLTGSRKLKNWWHYRKWYVITGIALFAAACSLVGNALGLFTKSPDLQVAYVGKTPLTQDALSALEQTFTALAGDYNKDGEVIVQVNQYVNDSQNATTGTIYGQYASEIPLIGDISAKDSYLFLMDDPQNFQREYQLLATPDGGCPDEPDYSVEDKAFLLSECPLLTETASGFQDSYTDTTSGQTTGQNSHETFYGLYLGRRCFYNGDTADYAEEYGRLWDLLYGSYLQHFN